jgi:SAM-dependent methyltransferase
MPDRHLGEYLQSGSRAIGVTMNPFVAVKRKIYSALSGRQQKLYLQKAGIRKLHLGCGKNILDGWLNTDLKYRKDKISFLDVSIAFPFQNETFDFIFCEHLIEHLTFSQAMNLLHECHRVLRPQGAIRISMPSLSFVFDIWKNDSDPTNMEYVRWAAQKYLGKAGVDYDENKADVYVVSNFFRDFGHKVIHSPESLKSLLTRAGFKEMKRTTVGESDIPDLRLLEHHGRVIPEEFNRLETLVVEARK